MADSSVSVWVIRYPDRPAFVLQWKDATGKRKSRSSGVIDTGRAADRRLAEQKARELEKELSIGLDVIPSEMTWADFQDRYTTQHVAGLAKASAAKIGTVCNLIDAAGVELVKDLTADRIAGIVTKARHQGTTESTLKSYIGTMRAMLRWGVARKYLPECPTLPTIRRAKKSGGGSLMKGRPITGEEFDRMLAAAPAVVGEKNAPAWQRYLRGLWLSGLRLAESVDLWWDRDDKIMPVLPRPGAGLPVLRILGELEKGNTDRLLPMAPEFAIFLLETPEAERTGPVFVLPKRKKRSVAYTAEEIGKIISRIGRKAGVIVRNEAGGKDKKFASAHDLRRSFGDRWSTRVMPARLMKLMRHESIETTMRFYVGHDATETTEVAWQAVPGAADAYAAAFSGRQHNRSHNTTPPALTPATQSP
jgi:integrase